jgi:transposase-like protein
MAERGRPTKLDDLRAKRIIDALKAGHSFGAAARAGGIDEGTLHQWRRRGLSGHRDFARFYERVEEACQIAEDRCVQVLRSALEGEDLKLATDTAWKWLARRRAAEWAEQKGEPKADPGTQHEATGEDLAVVESVRAALLSRKTG